MRRLWSVLLAVTLVGVLLFNGLSAHHNNRAGGYSTVTHLTSRSRQWIMDRFGHCQTVEELLTEVDLFVCKECTYRDQKVILHQSFDFDRFVFRRELHGLCFDFAAFVKCVVLVWAEETNAPPLQVYLYDVRTKKGNHSYNFVVTENTTYFLDTTVDQARYQKGKEILGAEDLGNRTIREYCASYDEVIKMIH